MSRITGHGATFGATQATSRQAATPLLTGLLRHAARRAVQFHIPGHKAGAGMDPELLGLLGPGVPSIDLINIAPVDDLHRPTGIIKEAQELAAEAFGADRTFFSVQGTSCAIMAMVLSTCGPGDKILVPRNVHKSVLAALVLSGARPVFMAPELDQELGVAHGVSLATVRSTLARHADAKAVFVVNPTYFGVCADLAGIVAEAHAYGIPVLVDEAHGVHCYFHDELPVSAMAAGADMAATSVHKLGGSLTQSSILNVRGGLVNPDRVQAILSMLTTTSTSYLLLASLDAARRHLAIHGRELLDRTLRLARWARSEINRIPGLLCLGRDVVGDRSSSFDLDETKLCICVKGWGVTGIEVESILRDEFNIEVELSDLYNILCLITLGDTEETVAHLVQALQALAERFQAQGPAAAVRVRLPELPELVLLPREAFYAPTEVVPLSESTGRVAAESVMIYPPGIPILMPGERISEGNLLYIREHIEAGLPVQGPEDPALQVIRVVRET